MKLKAVDKSLSRELEEQINKYENQQLSSDSFESYISAYNSLYKAFSDVIDARNHEIDTIRDNLTEKNELCPIYNLEIIELDKHDDELIDRALQLLGELSKKYFSR